MLEKTRYCLENLDYLRRAVKLSPRGFKGILGAILTRKIREEADSASSTLIRRLF